jgi:hypothetical protein
VKRSPETGEVTTWLQNATKYKTGAYMPTISMFYGILILMYFYDNKRHNVPHIHAEYGEYHVTLAINDGSVLAGNLPRQKMKLVQAWMEIHKEDLLADWKLAVAGEPVFRIDPLK